MESFTKIELEMQDIHCIEDLEYHIWKTEMDLKRYKGILKNWKKESKK